MQERELEKRAAGAVRRKRMQDLLTVLLFMLLLPYTKGELPFKNHDYLFFPGIRRAVEEKAETITGYRVGGDGLSTFAVTLGELTDEERSIILKGCLINYNRVDA